MRRADHAALALLSEVVVALGLLPVTSAAQQCAAEIVSIATDGTPGDGESRLPARGECVSADGRYIAFMTVSTTLVPDLNSSWDVVVRDRLSGSTELVSLASNGAQGLGYSRAPRISANGR